MNELIFSFNWNGKLFTKYFTTIRPYFKDKYIVGENVNLRYRKGNRSFYLGTGRIYGKALFLLEELPEFDWMRDTGYNKETSIRILHTMYKNSNFNWDKQKFIALCIENIDYKALQERFHLLIDFEKNLKLTSV